MANLSLPSKPPVKPDRSWIGGLVGLAFIGLMIVLGLRACYASADAQAQQQASEDAIADAPPTLPKGFTDYGDGLAYKWAGDCSDGSDVISCNTLSLYAYKACSSVYAEANLLDSANTILGYTNGDVDTMAAGDRADIQMQYTEAADSIRLTKLACN